MIEERDNILALCAVKLCLVRDSSASSDEMERGLPIFYNELIEVLRIDENKSGMLKNPTSGSVHKKAAARSGKESLRLGYTISQVVHGYGALCQAITEHSAQHATRPITDREFNRLNFCLDVAIAEAVTEFSSAQRQTTAKEEVKRLGFLAHELRNALGNASAAQRLIRKGMVGVGGSTSQILEDSLRRMKDIIDRSLAEVRLRGDPAVERQRIRVIDLVGEVEATGSFEALAKSIQLHIEVAPDLFIEADRHLVVSALSNLVQNAIKFTRVNGSVHIRSRTHLDRVLIDVEDECGGLPPGKIEALFRPFSQHGNDKSGVGLGLSITRRAIALNNGEVLARDIPGKGCIFTLDLPRAAELSEPMLDISLPVQ